MSEKINYDEIANEIFEPTVNPEHVPQILDKHSVDSTDKGAFFFVKVMSALTESKRHRNFLQRVDSTRRKAEIDGEIIFFDFDAVEGKPIAIIAKSGSNARTIISRFEDIMEGKEYPQDYLSLDNFCNNLLSLEHAQLMIKDHEYSNEWGFSCISSDYKRGDEVKKGKVVLVIEKLNFTSLTLSYIQKYSAAADYCNKKIKHFEAVINATPKEAKVLKRPRFDNTTTLDKIWLVELKKYERLIQLLRKEYRETSQPFISEIDGKVYWNKYPAKGYQKYLMGLLYVCNDMNFIKHNLFNDVQLITICRNTFHCDIDPGSFPDMRGGKIDSKYIEPFTELLQGL